MNHSDVSHPNGVSGAQAKAAVLPGSTPRPADRARRAAVRPRTTDAYRAALERERWKLMLALENTEVVEVPMVADSMDSSSLEHERHVAMDTLSRKAILLAEVNSALERIRAGTYGLCGECGEPIPPGRLNALPWARLCLKCQEEEEIADRFRTGESGLRPEPVEAA